MCLLQALLHMYGIVRVAGVDFLACGTSCLNRFLNHNIMTLITFSANIQVSHWCTLQPAPSWQLFYIHIDNNCSRVCNTTCRHIQVLTLPFCLHCHCRRQSKSDSYCKVHTNKSNASYHMSKHMLLLKARLGSGICAIHTTVQQFHCGSLTAMYACAAHTWH